MTQEELYEALSGVCSNVAYRLFKGPVDPPFICYLFTVSGDLFADDTNYVPIPGFDVELYTEDKDPELELDVEEALRGLGVAWAKNETYIATEKLLEVVYSIELVSTLGEELS